MDAVQGSKVGHHHGSAPPAGRPRGPGGGAGGEEGRTHPDDDGAAAAGPRGGGLMSHTSASLSLISLAVNDQFCKVGRERLRQRKLQA